MTIKISVDNVNPVSVDDSTVKLSEHLKHSYADVIGSSGADQSVLQLDTGHPLIVAAHRAFAEHHRLVLSPDVIWVTITQGFARHINLNAEKYRSLFVSHEGKKRLEFWSNFLPGTEALPWDAVITQFSELVRKEIGDEKHDLVVSDFSTTGLTERVVSEAVLLDAMQSYFEYYGGTMCGIPEIVLAGTPEDWSKLHEKAKRLAAIEGLEFWMPQVLRITEQFVEASQGKVDLTFWKSIVKVNGGSGGPYINGWIMRLLPYIKDYNDDNKSEPNPILARDFYAAEEGWGGGGLTYDCLPNPVSKVPFIWNYMGTEVNHEIIAGVVGVTVVDGDGLKPVLGWAVTEPNKK